eukprot:184258_1
MDVDSNDVDSKATDIQMDSDGDTKMNQDSIGGWTSDILCINTSKVSQKTGAITNISLKFKLKIDDGICILKMAQDGQSLKDATEASLNKYKREVLVELLSHYFRYEAATGPDKQSKKELLALFCGCCGIQSSDYTPLIQAFLKGGMKQQIHDVMESHSTLLFMDLWDHIIQFGDKLNVLNKISDCLEALYNQFEDELQDVLDVIWHTFLEHWTLNPDEKKMHQAYLQFTREYGKLDTFETLEACFNQMEIQCKWKYFAYALVRDIRHFFKYKLAEELVTAAFAKANATTTTSPIKYTDEKEYLVVSIAGAVTNSLLRRYRGRNIGLVRRCTLIAIVTNMLFDYHQPDKILKPNVNIPTRLFIENKGGLRIVQKKFWQYTERIIALVSPLLKNLLVIYKGKMRDIVVDIQHKMKVTNSFQVLFDIDLIEAKKLELIKKEIQLENQELKRKKRVTLSDEDILQQCFNKVESDVIKATITRCIASYIKKNNASHNNLKLRSRLQIFHMTTTKPYSSLQC